MFLKRLKIQPNLRRVLQGLAGDPTCPGFAQSYPHQFRLFSPNRRNQIFALTLKSQTKGDKVKRKCGRLLTF